MVDTVTGYTAARMKLIEDSCIVGGEIVGDNLILTRYDTNTINAGNVRGAVGPMNPDGNPAGTFIMGGWASDPTGYLILDGRTITGGVATYPALAGIYPDWVSGADLVLPNSVGAVPMHGTGNGAVTGSMTHTLTNFSQLPSHTHTGPNHRHTGPSHSHTTPNHTHPNSAHGHGHTFATAGGNHSHPASAASAGNSTPGHFYTRVGTSGGNYDWYGGGTLTQWQGYANPPTSVANAGVYLVGGIEAATTSTPNGGASVTGLDGTGVTGWEGTGITGSTGASTPIDHTPRNLNVKFAVKT